MTGQDIIDYIRENHYETYELLAKPDVENNKMILTFAPPEEDNDRTGTDSIH